MASAVGDFSIGADNWRVANARDLDGQVETLRQAKPTLFTGVNTRYAGLALHPRIGELDGSHLRIAGGGGGGALTMATESQRWPAARGQFTREGYGQSEISPLLSFSSVFIDEFSGATGLPLPRPTSGCSTTPAATHPAAARAKSASKGLSS